MASRSSRRSSTSCSDPGFLLTVHNTDWDPRAGHHLAAGLAPVLEHGPDHLLWAIADDLIDGYFPFADRIGDAIDDVQDQVVRKATPDTVEQLFKLKRELIQVRRAISPVREVFNQLTNRDEKLIDPDEIIYFRDIYDHVIRLTDELDNYRELASATLDVYLTQVNNNLSVIMKRLTGVTVILAGIGAVAGIFGMSEAATALDGGEAQRLLGDHRGGRGAGDAGGRRPAQDRLDLRPGSGSARSRSSAPRQGRQRPRRPVASRGRRPPPPGPRPACRADRSTPTARPADRPTSRAARRTREPVGIADVVAERHDRRRSQLGQERLEGLALATRGPRPEVDDEPASVVGEVVRRQLAVDGLDGRHDGRPGRDPVVGLADVESDRWALALDEQPRRLAEDLRHAPGEHLGRRQRVLVAGTERGHDAGRVAAAREGAGLEAVVAEVGHAADADPGGHVRRGPAGQDRRRRRAPGGRPPTRASRRRARRASGHDRRGPRVARALGQGAVEVGHDEQAAGR